MPASWSRIHIPPKILSRKRSSRVLFISQRTTSLSECAVTWSIFGGAFISCSRAATRIDDAGYVTSPLDGVNREVSRQRELHPASHEFHGRLVAGRPARGEQLLRVGALARGARPRQLDVQFAVIAAR